MTVCGRVAASDGFVSAAAWLGAAPSNSVVDARTPFEDGMAHRLPTSAAKRAGQ
jgi:hypothetical protein